MIFLKADPNGTPSAPTVHGVRIEKAVTLTIVGSFAIIAISVCMMTWVFVGAVHVSLVVDVAAAIRGIVLIVTGIQERSKEVKANETHRVGRVAA